MSPRSWLNFAALAAFVTVLAVSYVALPKEVWSDAAIVAALLFAVSTSIVAFLPRAGLGAGNAVAVASLGPAASLAGFIFLGSGASFLAALAGYSTTSWTLDVLTVGGFVVVFSIQNAALKIIEQVSDVVEKSSSHADWESRIMSLSAGAVDVEMQNKIRSLGEDIQFAARDFKGQPLAENALISTAIDSLEKAVAAGNLGLATAEMEKIRSLLVRRESGLKRLRSKV